MTTHTYTLGDMALCYLTDVDGATGLMIYPADQPLPERLEKKSALDPMVQVKLAGDIYNGSYAPGSTLRNGESAFALKWKDQKVCEEGSITRIETVLEDARGYKARHIVSHEMGDPFFRCTVTYENNSEASVRLELLASFSLTGISPYLEGDASGAVLVHRIQSRWSQEGRLLTQSLEELQLESSWGLGAVRCERFGQVGSMPVNHYFPFLAVEDTRTHVFWGVQIAHPASWQMEIYRRDENIAISGGIADREMGHWLKQLAPGESFTTPEAIVTTACTERLDELCMRLTKAGEKAADAGPVSEQDLPILFNEYCTTWGCPSQENIDRILETIRGKGIQYFVIDCGWYKADGVPWDISMGDYVPSKTLFPEGLEKTTERIRAAGFVPGIWFEIENVGAASNAYHLTDHLLKRDGAVLTTTGRRFWDMQDPWVHDYLRERVIGTLKQYGFGYLKVDYNDTIGIGCDGAESLGEGLRRNMQASMAFLEEIRREVPGIVMENCASGGHRLEPGFMAATSMASFSDAHECVEIPIIAANLHRVILPRQSQIWAVIRKEDSCRRIAYSIANTFLGRMCLSGDVTDLSREQWDVIDRGIAFYRRIAPIIRNGRSYLVTPQIRRMRHPEGWQALVRLGENGQALVVVHTFGGPLPGQLEVSLPEGTCETILDTYSDTEESVTVENGTLRLAGKENWKAVAVLLQ